MPAPGEHKTVQARILAYAQEIGWRFVPRAEAEVRRGFDADAATPQERARKGSLYFGDLLHAQVRAFNPKYNEAEGALIGEFQRFHADIYGNRDFLQALRNQHKFFCAEESRELDLTLREGELPSRVLGLVMEWGEMHQSELMENRTTLAKAGNFKRSAPLV